MIITKLFGITLMMGLVFTQTPIPPKQEGVEIGTANSPSRIDLFYDAHCPDSKDFYNLVKSVLSVPIKGKPVKDQISIAIHTNEHTCANAKPVCAFDETFLCETTHIAHIIQQFQT